MAYTRELDHKCGNSWCGKRTALEVFNYQNTSYGTFCRKCGKDRARRLTEDEKAEFNRRPA